jgi:DNA-binding transcriptional LysR family regulator
VELRHLRYFVAAAEEKSLTRAAARLHLSQPPLSRQIRDLEEELGVKLFQRKVRSICLTSEGKVFLKQAYAVLDAAAEALKTAKALASGVHGDFHLGFAPSLTVEILPKALRHFHECCQGMETRLYDLSTEEMLDRLRNGTLDAALLIEPQEKDLSGIEFVPIRRNAAHVAVHPSHPLARRSRIKLDDLAAERLITYSKKDYPEYHVWLKEQFSRNNHTPHIAEEHDGSASLIASVESGKGVSLVQAGFESLAGSRLVLLPVWPELSPFVVGLAYPKTSSSTALTCFRKSVEAVIADLG